MKSVDFISAAQYRLDRNVFLDGMRSDRVEMLKDRGPPIIQKI